MFQKQSSWLGKAEEPLDADEPLADCAAGLSDGELDCPVEIGGLRVPAGW